MTTPTVFIEEDVGEVSHVEVQVNEVHVWIGSQMRLYRRGFL